MSGLPPFRRLFRLGSHDVRQASRDIDEELASHLAMRIEHLRATGLGDDEAHAEAARRFGDLPAGRAGLIDAARRRARRRRWLDALDSLALDARFALRQLRRRPGNALFGIASLSLGIGLATAFFAAVNGVLLRPLPFRDSGRLVSLQALDSAGNIVPVVSADDWHDWNTLNRSFDGIALHGLTFRVPVTVGDAPFRVSAVTVAPGFFTVVGARMRMGRDFDSTDARSRNGVIISEALWRRAFGGQGEAQSRNAPSVSALSRAALTLRMGVTTQRVIGVVAAGREYPAETELWLPYAHTQMGGAVRNNINWMAVGRMRRGMSEATAQQDLARIARDIRTQSPEALYSYGVHVAPLRDLLVSNARLYLRMLMGAVVCVLLIACVNLAGINLARGTSRTREMAVRAAIGASRPRLVRQLLMEHVVLALMGGVAGIAVAWGMVRGIVTLASSQLPRVHEIGIDARVLLFAAVAAVAVGLFTGLLPALQAGRTTLAGSMAAVGRGTARGWTTTGRVLVASEIALAVILVVGGGLLLRSFRAVLAAPLGYETRGVVTAELSLLGARYRADSTRMQQFWSTARQALQRSPGVTSAAVANWIPLGMGGQSFIDVEGRSARTGGGYRVVSGGYFAAMSIPLVAGRDFVDADALGSPRVGIVNRRMARQFWPGENPIGKRVRAPSMEAQSNGAPSAWITIVGVVGDVRHWGAESEVRPELYVHYAQLPNWWRTLTVVVRASTPVPATTALVRARLRDIDPLIAADIEPFAARLERSNGERRFTMSLLLLFGGLALLLAAIGVYSVLAFQVALRTRELAVRAALGAERGGLLRLVLGSGARFIVAGAIAGLLMALAASRVLQSLVFQISVQDPLVFAASLAVIVLVAFAAALIPAIRATRVEPMIALQQE